MVIIRDFEEEEEPCSNFCNLGAKRKEKRKFQGLNSIQLPKGIPLHQKTRKNAAENF